MVRLLKLSLAAVMAAIMVASIAAADMVSGTETYDLLFKEGTLDMADQTQALVYQRDVTSALAPEAATRDTGQITLGFEQGDTGAQMAVLNFRKDEKHRSLGSFPASVGNPMIMYFYETVVRDMAEAAGGSPFYIRNRVKEALIAPSEIETGETTINGRKVATSTILMRPFDGDPNVDKMQGFGDLELRVTVSEAVPGWYVSMVAEAAGGDIYRNTVTFDHLGAAE